MKKKNVIIALIIEVLAITFIQPVSVKAVTQESTNIKCVYVHDPRINEIAMEDIVVNPNAIYGFSPDPNSTRLGEYSSYDWSDPEVVESAKKIESNISQALMNSMNYGIRCLMKENQLKK